MTSRKILIGMLALTALVYLPGVFRNDFVSLDDMLLITNNEKVHGIDPEHIWRIFTSYDPELYVPLTLLTYQMEHAIVKLHPFLYHLDNLLLHLGSIVLVFMVLKRLTQDELLALFSAGIFALHPLQVEAISWAAARKDLLSGFLVLCSMLLFLNYREKGSERLYGWSVALYVLALLAKVSVILIPFSIVILDLLRGDFRLKKGSMEFAPFALAAVFFGMIAMLGKTLQLQELTFAEQILLSSKAIAFTLLRFLLPTGLSVYHPQLSPVTALAPEFLLAISIVILLAGTGIALHKRMPLFTYGLSLALLALIPSFMNIWKKDVLYFTSERYAYIAMIGHALALGAALRPLWERFSLRNRTIVASIVAILLSGMSFAQAQAWQGSTALYTRALIVTPGFPIALHNLGAAMYDAGDTARALKLYEEAIMRDPTMTASYNNIALHRRKTGDIEGALAMVRTGLERIPADRPALTEEIQAWQILGSLLDERGMREEALATYRKAVDRAPKSGDAHYNLAVTLQKYRHLPESREHFLAYLALYPRDIEARYRLAAVEAETGLLPEAAKNLQIIVTRSPDYEKAAEHLERIRHMMTIR